MCRVPLESSRRALSKSQGPVRSLRASRKAMFMFSNGCPSAAELCGSDSAASSLARPAARSFRACLLASGLLHSRGSRASAWHHAFSHPSLPTADPRRARSDRRNCIAGESLNSSAPGATVLHFHTNLYVHVMEPGALLDTFSPLPL